MKALKSILAFALGLVCTVALAQDSLKEVVASGNKVYVRIVNDQEHPIPADEIEDVTREFAAAGAWERVEEASEADFILNVEAKKKVVFNSPRTWLTPSVVDTATCSGKATPTRPMPPCSTATAPPTPASRRSSKRGSRGTCSRRPGGNPAACPLAGPGRGVPHCLGAEGPSSGPSAPPRAAKGWRPFVSSRRARSLGIPPQCSHEMDRP